MNALVRFLTFKDIDLYDRRALELVGFKVTNSALVLHNQLQREQQEEDQTFYKFILALRTFLMSSISKDLWWKGGDTITPNEDGKNMVMQPFATAMDDMHRKLINKQGRTSITDELKICIYVEEIV